jgi:mono/diheme cytochrome c family protein
MKRIIRLCSILVLLSAILIGYNHCIVKPQAKRRPANSTDNNSDNINNNDTNGATSAELYFTDTVEPLLQQNCNSCHTLPQNFPPVIGPITIYDYDIIKSMVQGGNSNTQNELMDKVQGITSHGGGNRCPTGQAHPVCQTIAAWWQLENPDNGNNSNTNQPTGAVTNVSSSGRVVGWAANPDNTSETLSVKFYVNGEINSGGIYAGTAIAASSGYNGGYSGSHAFYFNLPPQFNDGIARTLYIYANSNSIDYEFQSMPKAFTTYAFSVAGQNYYNSNLLSPLSSSCSSCHAVSYNGHFLNLLEASPANGGSATNNQLINMATGSHNGQAHPGGNICGSKDSYPCNLIQTWWQTEF